MEACEQTKGMNMIQHGQMVHAHYQLLINQLQAGLHDCKELQTLWMKFGRTLPHPSILERYHVYHDCGKHLCLIIDEHGRRHFPNHAELSAQQYARIFPEDGFTTALIRHDMDFHLMRGDDLKQLWKTPFAPILYFSAWAEISANAEMFGGRESESYKIKKIAAHPSSKKVHQH